MVWDDQGRALTQKVIQVMLKRVARRANVNHLAMRGAPARAIQELVESGNRTALAPRPLNLGVFRSVKDDRSGQKCQIQVRNRYRSTGTDRAPSVLEREGDASKDGLKIDPRPADGKARKAKAERRGSVAAGCQRFGEVRRREAEARGERQVEQQLERSGDAVRLVRIADRGRSCAASHGGRRRCGAR